MDKLLTNFSNMWTNWNDFSGKTKVEPFWWAVLANFLVTLVLSLIANIIPVVNFVSYLYGLIVLVPMIAMGMRRLRDANYTPLLILLILVPIIGWIALIILWVQPSR